MRFADEQRQNAFSQRLAISSAARSHASRSSPESGPHEEETTERLLSELLWLPVDDLVSRTAASLARAFRAANVGIDDADYLVAATAVLLDAELLTTNVKHFPMFPGLRPAY